MEWRHRNLATVCLSCQGQVCLTGYWLSLAHQLPLRICSRPHCVQTQQSPLVQQENYKLQWTKISITQHYNISFQCTMIINQNTHLTASCLYNLGKLLPGTRTVTFWIYTAAFGNDSGIGWTKYKQITPCSKQITIQECKTTCWWVILGMVISLHIFILQHAAKRRITDWMLTEPGFPTDTNLLTLPLNFAKMMGKL